MNSMNIEVTFPFQDNETTAAKVFSLHYNNIVDSIKASRGNKEALLNIRRELTFALMEVDALESEIAYPNINRDDDKAGIR